MSIKHAISFKTNTYNLGAAFLSQKPVRYSLSVLEVITEMKVTEVLQLFKKSTDIWVTSKITDHVK